MSPPEEVWITMPPQTGPEQSAGADPDAADHSPADQGVPDHDAPDQDTARHGSGARPAASAAPPTEPTAAPAVRILPAQSREDTDSGWGDYRDPDDDDRLLRDRPPHWGNG